VHGQLVVLDDQLPVWDLSVLRSCAPRATPQENPAEPFGMPVSFEAEPGTLLVMAAATWHRSGLNRSSDPRTAMLMSFVEGWIKPMSAPTDGLAQPLPERLARLLGLDAVVETINGVRI
jgi:ectoine hydroxylase-related dioxygenase (phytanoyl-CoA dioxygenase family)